MTHILMHEPNIDTVYIDETTFHLWMQPGRLWIKRGMKVELPDTRGHSISVIGALSVRHGLLLTHVFQGSNNSYSFLKFIQDLKAKCEDNLTYVVMDNLSMHHSNLISKEFNMRFIAKFLPTYSCELNPIEKVWNLLKMKWRRTAHEILLVGKKKEDLMAAAVRRIELLCDTFDQDLMIKMARGNYDSMRKALLGYLV